ncbi:MAG TPA: phosphotransferase family protein [Qipengyuania sp.]|nr:phosphotransferase family protein [Qipengyuania sp.]
MAAEAPSALGTQPNLEPEPGLADALLVAAGDAGLAAQDAIGLRRLSGGASKEMWGFTLVIADGERLPLVLRRQPPGRAFSNLGLGSVVREAAIMRFAEAAGIPVPRIAFELPLGSPAGDGYAMAHVAGETVGTRVLRLPELAEARAGLARRCGEVLARLHAAQGFDALGLQSQDGSEALTALKARHHATAQDRPVFAFALRWLADNLPPGGHRCLLHGDFRTGNLVIGPEGLRAVLDWELAHVGSPAADLAWLCVPSWRFQRPELPVGGFGMREDLLAGYESAGGGAIDRHELFAWEVFQTLNWGVMCAGAGWAFMNGARSVEGAVIARRASETEFDLMRMLAPDHPAWSAPPATAVRYDDPPAALILAEVRAAQARGLSSGFAQKVAANALGIAQRELAADRRESATGDTLEELILDTLGKLAVDQPGYPGLRALREASGLGHPPAIGERSP